MPRKNGTTSKPDAAEKERSSSKYDPKFCDVIVKEMKEGASRYAAAAACGVSNMTLWRWEKKYPEFAAALKLGETLSQAWWEDIGRKFVSGKKGNSKGMPKSNVSLWIVNMRNRFKWKGQDPVEHKVGGKIEHGGKITVVVDKQDKGLS